MVVGAIQETVQYSNVKQQNKKDFKKTCISNFEPVSLLAAFLKIFVVRE
jgi:hypothetical protein